MFVSRIDEAPTPIGVLADQISTLAADISAATCRWLLLIAEFDRREGWGGSGCRSCADWLAWQCSLSLGTARDHVRVARRLEQLPLVREAFAAGKISYSKVRALTRVESVADEARILELANHATAAQLERMVGAFRGLALSEAQRAHERRFLRIDYDDRGGATIRGQLPAEAAALIQKALELAEEESFGNSAESPELESTPATRRADALVWLADKAMNGIENHRTAGDRTQVVVHVDVQTLAGGAAAGAAGAALPRCEVDDKAQICAETARRLCCDAGIVTSLEKESRTLSVGRRTRSIPPSIRRALRSRQPECQFPGCTRTRWLDAHHITHWANGGETKLGNLVHLCHHHHKLVHEGGYSVTGCSTDGTLRVHSPHGSLLEATPRPRRGSCDQLLSANRGRGVTPGPDDLRPHSYTPMNLGWCVDEVMRCTEEGFS